MSSTRKDTIREFFFFSEEDLRDFQYDTHKFGGLRFFLELAVFFWGGETRH
jgi:hypothetical protein